MTDPFDRAMFNRQLAQIIKDYPDYSLSQCLFSIVRPVCNTIGDLYSLSDKELLDSMYQFKNREDE